MFSLTAHFVLSGYTNIMLPLLSPYVTLNAPGLIKASCHHGCQYKHWTGMADHCYSQSQQRQEQTLHLVLISIIHFISALKKIKNGRIICFVS